jgi:signal transduction histidine kinase
MTIPPEQMLGGSATGGSATMFGPLLASPPSRMSSSFPNGATDQFESEGRKIKRILIVEDDAPIQSALASLLDDEGYQVSLANDGEEALNRMEGDALPDLILLDLRMPVMDGWEFRSAQKRDSRLAQVPVVVLSADGSSHAAAVSADAFLPKPLDTDQLLATIERVLSADEQRRSATQWRQAERVASLDRVAAGIGHEVNNPLAFVLLNVSLAHARIRKLHRNELAPTAAKGPAPAVLEAIKKELLEVQDTLADSLVGLERIRGIVDNLQVFSRRADVKRNAVQIETVLDESIAMARKHIQYRARIEKRYGAVPAIEGDSGALGQVFLNLLINAAQAIPEGHVDHNEIAIVTSFDGKDVLVEIGDTGQGIAADVLPHIFDPFFTTKAATGGTGLGLALSRQIVREHRGRLDIQSAPGSGTVCSVYLRPVDAPS